MRLKSLEIKGFKSFADKTHISFDEGITGIIGPNGCGKSNIIELGMVDDIIKDKDNSRRRMLEQAAGVTIYKTRKKEARQKLDATEQDLARIEDLLFEINNQLKSLENQAKKAEKYYEIKKEYKEVSIELAKASLEGFNITYRDLNQQQQAEVDRRLELEAAIATEEAALEHEK